ncbi:MAG: FAD-dependent oxidoreductase [Acidobacteria bacterium]|nr:FAD-dependent oxidoreductase [Acidobacteriota bacterium]
MRHDYDLVVIGGGAAGLTAAGMAASLGAKTALVEAGKLGGDCTWHGCVPSKSLLKAAHIAQVMRHADRFGLTPAPVEHDFRRVMERVRAIREHVYEEADSPPNLERLGVEVITGRARFVSPHVVAVSGSGGERQLSASRIVIATGTSPRRIEIPGMDSVRVLTNETLFELDELPRQLLVIGGGPIGVEMAQAFSRLGSRVTMVEASGRILPKDDAELSQLLLERLRAEGLRVLLNTQVLEFAGGQALTSAGERFEAGAVLLVVGRSPNLAGLNLEAAGVRYGGRGIEVDQRCRTTVRHIYAAGDVAGRHMFTHMAEQMARVAVTNAVLRMPSRIEESVVPWTTFTDPELAHVGSTEEQLRRERVRYKVFRFPYSQLDRAITDTEETGMVKVLAGGWGRILGVSILGAHAGELIAEYALAMKCGIRLDQVSATIHPYPTYALANRRAADLFVMSKFTPAMAKWMRWALRLRGRGGGEAA